MNNHFFVTLPSDSSAAYYPNNTVARFVTKLPETIRLEGRYEMALAEIIYPHTWHNVEGDNWIAFDYEVAMSEKVHIPPGYYEDGTALVDRLNQAPALNNGAIFSFNRTTGRFTLNFRSSTNCTFVMSEDLQRYTGLEPPLHTESFSVTSKQDFNPDRGMNLMYVYCDVASHSIVGDTKAPLLRVCNVTGKHGNIVRHTYFQPHYVPVGRQEFDTIEIGIYNEVGKPMPFQYGKSVITLHFRRKWMDTSI